MLRKALEKERERYVDPTVGNNKIVREIRSTARERPELILRSCRDTGLGFTATQRAFGLENLEKRRPPNHLKGTARDTVRAFYAMFPLGMAILLTFNLDDPESKFLAFLRKNEGAEFEDYVRRWGRITDWQQDRWERGL